MTQPNMLSRALSPVNYGIHAAAYALIERHDRRETEKLDNRMTPFEGSCGSVTYSALSLLRQKGISQPSGYRTAQDNMKEFLAEREERRPEIEKRRGLRLQTMDEVLI